MAKQKVSAKEVATDIRSGVSDAELMRKYSLSAQGLQYLFRKLIENNVVKPQDVSERGDTHPRPIEP